MKTFGHHFKAFAAAKTWAEAHFACPSSRRAVVLLDAILVASISVLLALEFVITVAEFLAVGLLVRKAAKRPLKAAEPVPGN